jgi:cytochrome bd-type quinol oxidase subunit 2
MSLFQILASQGSPTEVVIKSGITPPSLSNILEFVIKGFFILAGLAAILYLLLGAFSWITSGGSKENVEKAREKIQAAVLGLIIIFLVLSLVVLVENIFNFGLGVSREIKIPTLSISGLDGELKK